MKLQEMKIKVGASQVSKKKNGNYIARFGFFYRMGKSAEGMQAHVQQIFRHANIVDYGEHYVPFRGGQPVAKQSHWYIEFNFKEQERP